MEKKCNFLGLKKMTQRQEGVGGRVKVVGRDTARTWKKSFQVSDQLNSLKVSLEWVLSELDTLICVLDI